MRSRKTLAILAALALAAARLGAQSVLTAGTKTPFKLDPHARGQLPARRGRHGGQ